jgi:hypothetical protein
MGTDDDAILGAVEDIDFKVSQNMTTREILPEFRHDIDLALTLPDSAPAALGGDWMGML